MTDIFRSVFDLATSQFSVSDNPLLDYLGMALILGLAYKLAFGFVGDLYHTDVIHSKIAGSVIHWGVRIALVYLLVQLIPILF